MNPQAAVKSKSEKFAPVHEDSALAFSMHPPHQPRQPYMGVHGTSPVAPGRSYAVPSISSRSGPQPGLSASIAGTSWSKKHKEDDVRMAPARPISRPTKSMTVSDFSQGQIPQQAPDLSSISTLVAARNGAGGNHYRERGGGRIRDNDIGQKDGEQLIRRSDRHEGNNKNELSSKRDRYRHDQASMITSDGPYRRDLTAVDSHQRDAQSKVPSVVNPTMPTVRPLADVFTCI